MNSSAKTINLEFLVKFTKGDKEKIRRYIAMYLVTTSQVIDEMEKFLKENNLENVRLKAHSMKPQVQYMGITDLTDILLQIEKIIVENGEREQLIKLINSAETINNQATKELKLYMDEL